MKNSSLILTADASLAAIAIQRGEVIAYPTEAVYGLGCDPFNEAAVQHLLAIKERPIEKSLILVASDWEQVKQLTQPISETVLNKIFTTWPGPHTWVFPASAIAPHWITGNFSSIAIRISAHPTIQALCQIVGPIVSTSANMSNAPACRDADAVQEILGHKIALLLLGATSGLSQPTIIRDAITEQVIRA